MAYTRKIIFPNVNTSRKKADLSKAVVEVRRALKGVPISDIKTGSVVRNKHGEVVFVKEDEDLGAYEPVEYFVLKGQQIPKAKRFGIKRFKTKKSNRFGVAKKVTSGQIKKKAGSK